MRIVVQNLSERIYGRVRDRILCDDFPVDAAIRQDALAAELGVSKIPLREAMARLEQDGLLFSQANRGFFVRPLSPGEAEEVYALRLKIEPEAVGLAAQAANSADREAARRALEALDAAAAADKSQVGRLNREFHLSLVRPSKRPLTVQMVERLNIISERYVRKHLEPAGRDDRAHQEHTAMYDLWADGRSDEVAALMHAHIALTLDDLRRQFEAEREDAVRP
jgi:DNA-binding GntR family transcriptional regulator